MKRRESIIKDILESDNPLSASKLAQRYHVSRQIIVGDIALLRASGHKIIATPRGYIIDQDIGMSKVIAVRHSREEIVQEMNMIVDLGGRIKDVIIEHPLYGEIRGNLQVASRLDVKNFMDHLDKKKAEPLSYLTNGIHLHTIYYDNDEVIESIIAALDQAGFLLKE